MAHIVTFVVMPCILGAGMLLLLEAERHIGLGGGERIRKRRPKRAARAAVAGCQKAGTPSVMSSDEAKLGYQMR